MNQGFWIPEAENQCTSGIIWDMKSMITQELCPTKGQEEFIVLHLGLNEIFLQPPVAQFGWCHLGAYKNTVPKAPTKWKSQGVGLQDPYSYKAPMVIPICSDIWELILQAFPPLALIHTLERFYLKFPCKKPCRRWDKVH